MSRRNKTPRATKIVTAKVTMVEQRNVHSLLANDTRSNNFLARDTPTKDTKSLAAIKSARARSQPLSFNCENLVKSRQPIDNRAAKIEVDPSAFSETTRNKVISRSAINIGYFYLPIPLGNGILGQLTSLRQLRESLPIGTIFTGK